MKEQHGIIGLASDAVILAHIDSCVLEWSQKSSRSLIAGEMEEYRSQRIQLSTLQEWRRQIKQDSNEKKNTDARESANKLMEAQRQLDESFAIPRINDGEAVTTAMNLSAHSLLRIHRLMQKRLMQGALLPSSVREQYAAERSRGIRETATSVAQVPLGLQLIMEMKIAMFKSNEPFQIYYSLWHPQAGFLTEEYFLSFLATGFPTDMSKMTTIFTDVHRENSLNEAYLVCKLYRCGTLLGEEISSAVRAPPNPNQPVYIRPLACGILSLAEVNLLGREPCREVEPPAIPLYHPVNESDFSRLHELIFARDDLRYVVVPQSLGIQVGLTLVPGDLRHLRDTLFIDCPDQELRTNLCSSPVINWIRPLDHVDLDRDDIFVTICTGEFSQGSKTAPLNVEITLRCVDESGRVVPDCLARGCNRRARLSCAYTSTVYYHSNNPSVNETARISLPVVRNILKCHLFFTLAHCASNQQQGGGGYFGANKDKKARNYFGFGFLPLRDASRGGVILQNGEHFISVYNFIPEINSVSFDDLRLQHVMCASGNPIYLTESQRPTARQLRSGSQEHLKLHIQVASPRFSHITEIHNILNWKEFPSDQLPSVIDACLSLSQDSAESNIREITQSALEIMIIRPELPSAFQLFVNMLTLYNLRATHKTQVKTKDCTPFPSEIKFWNVCVLSVLAANANANATPFVILQGLNASLKNLAESAPETGVGVLYSVNTLRCTPTILRLVISHASSSDVGEGSLVDGVRETLGSIGAITPSTEGDIFISLRQIYSDVFVLGESLLSDESMGKFGTNFLRSLVEHPNGHQRSVKEGIIQLMSNLIMSKTFTGEQGRLLILRVLVDTLDQYFSDPLSSSEDRASSIAVTQILLEELEHYPIGSAVEYLMGLFEPVISGTLKLMAGIESRRTHDEAADAVKDRSSMKIMKSRRTLANPKAMTISDSQITNALESAACCLISLFNLLGVDSLRGLLQATSSGKTLLLEVLVVLTMLVKKVIIPHPWLLLHMSLLNSVKDIIVLAAGILSSSSQALLSPTELTSLWARRVGFLKEVDLRVDDFEEAALSGQSHDDLGNNLILWSVLTNLSLDIMLHETLTRESREMNPAKLSYLSLNYADYRLPVATALGIAWDSIAPSGMRLKFAKLYTNRFIALACSYNTALSGVGKKLVLDLLREDYHHNTRFLMTSPHIYDCVSATLLGVMDQSTHPDLAALTRLMEGGLATLFQSDPVLNCESAYQFASEMSTLLALLRDLSSCAQTAEFEEDRSYAYAKLMDFFLRVGRREAYVKTAHSLSKEMAQLENFVEAGNALLLHYNLVTWGDDMLESVDLGEAGGVIPAEFAWVRKMRLLDSTLELLDKGKAWEKCISLLDEPLRVYKSEKYDYLRVVNLLHRQSTFYTLIATQGNRYAPPMFRVGYYGAGFRNDAIRNKEFIYRGAPLESSIDFSNRVKNKFPTAERLSPKVTPSEVHFEYPGQWYQITTVTSASLEEAGGAPPPSLSKLPPYVKEYIASYNINCFFYLRPFRKRETKSANEFLDLWAEKVFLETDAMFPSISRRAEVIRITRVILNPVEMAVRGLLERNAELEEKNDQMSRIPDGEAGQHFTMCLSGTVDAAVNGGIKNYESFITGTYREANKEIADDVDSSPSKRAAFAQLKTCLVAQLALVEIGIHLHRKKCLESMKPLHDHIEKTFLRMKAELNALLNAY